ncbi:MAG: DUF1631 family protein, partial [Rubrivivax sp.]|nr:DUF1631 family protein [Rubrivivax sp.]
MNAPPALQHFVDEELLRAPLLFEQALDALLAQWQSGRVELMPAERAAVAELPRRLLAQRPLLVDAYVRSLRTQTAAELSGRRAAPLDALATGTALSLVDEDEVAVEIGLARTLESVKSVADHELRELLTYTSALAGDMDVARDHNPLRAETQARALWAAAQMLPAERGVRAAFMRHAGLPLAQSLRKAFASACARLETTGIEPATYRTLILPPGARRPRRNDTTVIPELGQLRQALPVPEPPLISLFLTDA